MVQLQTSLFAKATAPLLCAIVICKCALSITLHYKKTQKWHKNSFCLGNVMYYATDDPRAMIFGFGERNIMFKH